MTPIFFNSSSHTYNSPYPSDDHHEDHLGNHQFLNHPNTQAFSSSNSLGTHLSLNSTAHDQSGTLFAKEIQPPQYQQEGDNFGSQAYHDHPIERNDSKSLEFSTWGRSNGINEMINNDQTQMKWMSSKMRVMLKMKKSDDPVNIKFYSSATRETTKLEDHKSPTYPMEETDNSSNSTSSNNNIPIRVCSDCNTTKTPLWRSGPRGPKSLCNACGIRQRKARRALAIAAAENGNSNNIVSDQSMINMAPLKVTKNQLKDFKKPNNGYKKRQYFKHIKTTTMVTTTITPPSSLSPSPSPSPASSPLTSPSSSPSPARKNCVEDFLVSLSKNLTFNYHVFPQDEKEAAILLMAISCGYAHET